MSSQPEAKPRIDIIDGLRAVAVGLVVWYHFWQITWLQAHFRVAGQFINLDFIPAQGALGVELFLFLSGFCLFYSYVKRAAGVARIQPLGTYAYRRAIKILPSYFLAMLMILIMEQPFGERPFATLSETAWQLFTHVFFIHNLFPATHGTINGVFWTLGVEVQFYVLFPLIAWFFIRRPLATALVIAAGANLYRLWIAATHKDFPPFLVNQLPGFLDFFLGGMLAAHLIQTLRAPATRAERWGFTALAAVGVLGTIGVLFWCARTPLGREYWQLHYRSALVLALMAASVGGVFAHSGLKLILANRATIFLSTISYNLYIWHFFIGTRLKAFRIPEYTTADPHDDHAWKWAFFLLATGLSVAVAAAFTYFFERPLLHNGVRQYLPAFGRKRAKVQA